MIDEKLLFTDHLNSVYKIALSNLNKIRDLFDKHFGMPTHLAINLYSAYIRSTLETSYMCWSTISEHNLNELETIQGETLKSIMKIKDKLSYNALDVEAGIIPIKIRLKQIIAQFGIKILRKPDHDPIKLLLAKNLDRQPHLLTKLEWLYSLIQKIKSAFKT